ncbi:otefin-like [Phlebotomus argentipes]|uniref:otefin-like n=1 Tax=Phlebotomus argentipes TaxID=94469 RepID=UPI0028936B27|nr:otefin-like [Phlebotomus argentipes]
MSAESDNLEALSNNELMHRMTELGLPKIPITDTTRKLLIKRIRNHVKEAKTKTRRETVAVVQYSSDEDLATQPSQQVAAKATPKKAEVNRRATVATPTRRSGRVTPTPVVPATQKSVPATSKLSVAPTIYEIIDDSDDDVDDILTQRPPRRSKSKSPSLSRSDVVTTSYKQVIESVKESPEEEEQEAGDEMDVDEAPEPVFSQYRYRPPSATFKPNSTLEATRRTLGGFSSVRSPGLSYEGRYSTLGSSGRARESQPRENLDAPYLSEFTRRLSELKAQRLDTGSTHFRSESSATRAHNPEQSVTASLVAVFNALDKKFSLKRNLLIVSAVLLVIFLFVFFLY